MGLTVLLLIARAAGALFIFSGVSKLVSRYAFLASLRALFLPSLIIAPVAAVLPWLEVMIGSLLVMGFLALYTAWVSLALLLTFSLVAIVAIVRGVDVPCSCFGTTSRAPLSWKTLVRNLF